MRSTNTPTVNRKGWLVALVRCDQMVSLVYILAGWYVVIGSRATSGINLRLPPVATDNASKAASYLGTSANPHPRSEAMTIVSRKVKL